MAALGLKIERISSSLPYLTPIVDRSGPTHWPFPCTRWQLPHELAPARKKTARPFSASPSRRISSKIEGNGRPAAVLGRGKTELACSRKRRSGDVCKSVVASFFKSSGSLPARASSITCEPPSLSCATLRNASRRRPSG